jgi:hypothetical protein
MSLPLRGGCARSCTVHDAVRLHQIFTKFRRTPAERRPGDPSDSADRISQARACSRSVLENPVFAIGAGGSAATAGSVCATHARRQSALAFFANPVSRKKPLLERSIDRKRVYTPAVERPNTDPAKGGEKQCLAMGVGA